MATMTQEQIEQKKQLLAEKVKEMKAIYDELVEAGAITPGKELSDDELDAINGGGALGDSFKKFEPIPQCFTDYCLSPDAQ
jgi:bacteriocin-like protein